jgi:hypothetical protein
VHLIATFETDHQRTLSGGAHERPSADSVNGSDNEEESEHAISDSHDSRSVSPNAGDISVWAARPTCKAVVRSSSGGGSCSLCAQDWAILLRHSSVGDWQTLGIDEHRWVVKAQEGDSCTLGPGRGQRLQDHPDLGVHVSRLANILRPACVRPTSVFRVFPFRLPATFESGVLRSAFAGSLEANSLADPVNSWSVIAASGGSRARVDSGYSNLAIVCLRDRQAAS